MSREKQKNIKPINFSELLTMAQNYKSLILDKKTDLYQTRSYFIENLKIKLVLGQKNYIGKILITIYSVKKIKSMSVILKKIIL